VGPTGITAAKQLGGNELQVDGIQYDNGSLYLSSGLSSPSPPQVLNASTGALQGAFYTGSAGQSAGFVVSDSSLGRAFVANTTSLAVQVFDESSFNSLGSIPVGRNINPPFLGKMVRWGQDGV